MSISHIESDLSSSLRVSEGESIILLGQSILYSEFRNGSQKVTSVLNFDVADGVCD